MNERISFVVLLSCGLRETSSVDYTDFEEERLREKSFCMFQITDYITGPPQREEKFIF